MLQKNRNAIIYTASVILLSILFYIYHLNIYVSSDTVTTMPMSMDILQGNILLKGWILGTNNFYLTEIIPYAIGVLFGISKVFLINYIPGLVWSVMFAALIYFYMQEFDRTDKKLYMGECIFFVAIAACGLLFVAPIASYTLLNANSHNNLYMFSALYFLVLDRFIKNGKWGLLVFLTVFGGLLCFSESVSNMTLVAPVAVVALINIFYKEKRKTFISVFVSIVLSYIIGKLMFILFDLLGGMKTIGLPVKLTEFSFGVIKERVLNWLNQFSYFFGMESYFGHSWDLKKLVLTAFLVLYLTAGIFYTVRFYKIGWKKQLALFSAGINVCACVFTDVVIFHRYIVIGFYFGFILIALFFSELIFEMKLNKYIRYGLCGVAALLSLLLLSTKLVDTFNTQRANTHYEEMAEYVIEKDLGNAYGDFWAGPVISFYEDYKNNILPVSVTEIDKGIRRHENLVKNEWYQKTDYHYVIGYADGGSGSLNTEALFRICGEPDSVDIAGEFVVYYWEKDISGFVKNGLEDNRISTFEMLSNENTSDEQGKILIGQEGIVYGPYIEMEKGSYDVRVTGENLDVMDFDACASAGAEILDIRDISVTDDSITYTLVLDKDYNDVEFRLFNHSGESGAFVETLVDKAA